MKITDFFDFGGKIFFQTHHFPLLKLQGFVNELNYNLIDSEKNSRPVLVSAGTLTDKDHNIILCRATIFDISERKKYERELLRAKNSAEESERRFRFMAEAIPALVWTMESNGELDYYSRKFYDCTGKDFGDDGVTRADWTELIHPRDRIKTHKALDYALQNQVEYKIDHRIQNKNGGFTWMQSRAVPYKDDTGIIIKWFGATIDIDEEVKAREIIRKAQAQLNLLINTIPAIVAYVGRDYRYQMVNNMYEEWIGIKSSGVLNKTVAEVLGEEGFNHIKPYMDRALQGESVTFEYVLSDKNGRSRIVKVTYNPDKQGKKVNGFVSFVNDITKEKEFEQILENEVRERTKKLEETNIKLLQSNRDLEQFAYVASHDLKEPLRMISTYIQLIMMKLGEPAAEVKEYAGFVKEGVTRMRSLIDDILEYSQLERTGFRWVDVDVKTLVQEVIRNLENDIIQKNAIIELGNLPVVKSSHSLLGHLIQNLVSNALKFVNPDTAPMIRISVEKEGSEWVFSVADNGIGINPEYADKVFEIFKRLNSRENYSGTGIGLALCKRIIELHNGKIWFEPNPSGGTIFRFTTPL
jgi:PAS domain S-box-containing protein